MLLKSILWVWTSWASLSYSTTKLKQKKKEIIFCINKNLKLKISINLRQYNITMMYKHSTSKSLLDNSRFFFNKEFQEICKILFIFFSFTFERNMTYPCSVMYSIHLLVINFLVLKAFIYKTIRRWRKNKRK